MNNKIDQAILRLKKNVAKNNTTIIKINDETIIINDSVTEFWGTFLYLIFLIMMPMFFLIKTILDKDIFAIVSLIVFVTYTVYQLIKIVVGGTTLEINLRNKNIVIKNKHKIFIRIFKQKNIDFNEINKSELTIKSIKHKHRTSKWLRLSIIDKKGKKHILTDFQNDYPESSFANDVKVLIDAIIRLNKMN